MDPTSPLRLGIPQRAGGAMVPEGARAFAKVLSSSLHHPVQLHIVKDYAGLLGAAVERAVDLSWMPPFVYMAALDKGVSRLAAVCVRNGELTYRAALLVRAESPYRSIADLRGVALRLAWTDPSSAAGHIFPRLYLLRAGIESRDFASERFLGSPLATCAAVADGEADLCACFVRQPSLAEPERVLADIARVYTAAPWRLRALAVTDPIPADGIIVGAHVPAELGARIGRALLGLHAREDGRDALGKLFMAERLASVTAELQRVIDDCRAAHAPHWRP